MTYEEVDLFKFVITYAKGAEDIDTCDITVEDEEHALEKFSRWYPDEQVLNLEFFWSSLLKAF